MKNFPTNLQLASQKKKVPNVQLSQMNPSHTSPPSATR